MNSNFTTEHASFAGEYAGGAGAPPSRFDLKRIIRQCLPIVIGATLLLGVPAVAAVWFLVPLEYQATGELHFRITAPRVLDDSEASQDRANYEKWLTTQLDFLQGPTILQRVAQSRQVKAVPQVAAASDPLAFLQRKVRATSKRDSELVTISVHMKDTDSAVLICREVISEYLAFYNNAENDMNRGLADTLRKEKLTLESRLLSLRAEIVRLQKQIGIPTDSIGQIGPNQSVSFVEQLSDAEADLLQEQKTVERIEEQIVEVEALAAHHRQSPNEKIFEQEIEAKVNTDNRVTSVRSQLTSSETQISTLRNSSQKSNPALLKAEKDLASLRAHATEAEAMVRGQAIEEKTAQLRVTRDDHKKSIEDAEQRIANFKAKITEQEDGQLQAAEISGDLTNKQTEEVDVRDRLSDILDQLDRLNLERNAPARVTEASAPIAPERPDYSKRLQLMILALVGAFVVGAGLGLLREVTNQHARTVQDLSSITPLPILATIPHKKAERLPKDHQPEMLMADFPQSPTAQQYRRVLTRIIYPPDDTVEVNSCLVVSPTRGDGKTSLACNLAISLAQANRRVLLVDVCSRDPQIERCFGLSVGEGLSEVLFHDADYRTLVRSTEFSDLKVLGPGFHGDLLGSKLASREMMQFLERAEKDFDHIVIDTPPSLLMSDAKLMAPIVDGVIVTVGVGTSTLGMVRRCLSELDQVNANLIGVVLNGVRHTRGGYMAKNFELFYGYGTTNGAAASAHDLPEMTIADPDETQASSYEAAVMFLESDDPESQNVESRRRDTDA